MFRLSDLNAMALAEAEKKIAEAGRLPEDMGVEERRHVSELCRAGGAYDSLTCRTPAQATTSLISTALPVLRARPARTCFTRPFGSNRFCAGPKTKVNAPGEIHIGHDAERALVLQLDGFATALLVARDKRMPHVLCEHVYHLAQAFSTFYGALPIAAESDPAHAGEPTGACRVSPEAA